jgi:hypothetical protein
MMYGTVETDEDRLTIENDNRWNQRQSHQPAGALDLPPIIGQAYRDDYSQGADYRNAQSEERGAAQVTGGGLSVAGNLASDEGVEAKRSERMSDKEEIQEQVAAPSPSLPAAGSWFL